ncbi:hypothetical protein GPLA_4414 [Paraglaciecola polaris LMG 21857]|uniref:Toxin co-regulated pilus biosynthesis protein Q C-terminal domain-containing protein n=2 Tax=Paraglaciecola polaris TaxID=222814 RepID=K7A337_9ALTE|nr:hypothetical protein GPLA_4414 [Paraglaciecola polaris LMG 21857]|tara:strand:- start:1683 stop:2309 length:627 start_codon:yes stop_codon:yes gene_type:complete
MVAMKHNPSESQSFAWWRHALLALALILIAIFVIVLQQMNINAPIPEGGEGPKSVAQNMTDFYAEYRLSSRHPRGENIGDFVNVVNMSDTPLGERLKKMESLQKPLAPNWVGEYKHRSFKAGSTLRDSIISYAQSEGMQVIWELNRDFIIKHAFQIDNSIVGSLHEISRAIDSNFDGTVKTYVCPKQRSLVITAVISQYLKQNCKVVG